MSTGFARYAEWKTWRAGDFMTHTPADDAYFRAELGRTSSRVRAGLRVLELGFGNGGFAGWALANGLNYTGTELIEELVLRAKDANIRALRHTDDLAEAFAPSSLDVVVAFDVFEHLEFDRLLEQLEELRGLLRPGGCVLARVPSGDSPFGRAIFHGDTTHRLALGSSAVTQIAGMVKYKVRDIGPPAFPVFGLGLTKAVRRGMIQAGRTIVAGGINALFHDNQPRVITSNLTFVLEKAEVDSR